MPAREKVGWGIAGIAVMVYALLPVGWIVSLSLKAPSDLTNGRFLPTRATWENYETILVGRASSLFLPALRNSLGICLVVTVISCVLAMLAAYAIARLDFPGKKLILTTALAVAVFPVISLVTPLFDLWRRVGLYDTWPGLIIPYLSLTLPISIWMLTAFFRQIPWEMEAAAQVDGATSWQAFRKVVVPLATPGVLTTAIVAFFIAWNDVVYGISLELHERVAPGPGRARALPRGLAVRVPDRRGVRGGGDRDAPRARPGPGLPAPHRRRPDPRRGQGLRPARSRSRSLEDRPMAAIEITHVVKTYDDGFLAVDDVSLDVADGELMVLVGPSGSGKSTLLRMIVGLEEITSGDVVIGGVRVNDRTPRERNLSMVFQSYALYPHLSVYENIAFPLRLQQMEDAEVDRRVQDAADVLDLGDHLRRKPAHLSGGQRQRVAMGRAIVRRAEAFLFDEPLSNLDAKLRGQMRTEIARLQRRLAMTTVYVTHDQIEAMTLGDRVCVLRRGTVAQVASPRELYEQPANLFVAGFLGSPPMNFLAATVEHGALATPLGLVPLEGRRAASVEGRDVVVVGIRPEAFEDASLLTQSRREAGHVFTARVDVTEWLGDSQLVTIDCRAQESLLARLRGADQELNADALPAQALLSIDASSRVREGRDAQLWLDARKVHVFDHRTGENLTRDAEAGAELTRAAQEDRARLIVEVRDGRPGGAVR